MSSGMPVISTTVGGIKDMITNKENGYLYNAGDIEALVKLIDFLLQNKNERVRIGKNASNLRVKHTSENVCTQTLNAYNTILSKEND
jgi:glycosyltransferase involved in cell wall biosynthesis